MKNSILFLVFLLFISSSCSTQKTKEEKKKPDFSYLKIQRVLSEGDKKYYENVHNQISEIAKKLVFIEMGSDEACIKLKRMFIEISDHPFSRERERERKRERELIVRYCSSSSEEAKNYSYNLSDEEVEYLNIQLPNSAVFFDLLKDREGALMESAEGATEKKFHSDKLRYYGILAQLVDPIDLSVLRYNSDPEVEKEYCRKALELKQWDHIADLTEFNSGAYSVMACLDKSKNYPFECKCPEAVKLIIKKYPKQVLYDPSFHNPSADEMDKSFLNSSRTELRNAIKKITGRDLDKEPKVYFYKGDPGR